MPEISAIQMMKQISETALVRIKRDQDEAECNSAAVAAAFDNFETCADKAHAQLMDDMGVTEVPEDYKKADYWARKACNYLQAMTKVSALAHHTKPRL